MDSSKAKKAKAVSKSRKAQTAAAGTEQQRQLGVPSNAVTGKITPEVTAPQIALQTPTVNPYHMMGTMPPNYYNPGNVISGGYTS
jgi:hypothetical protein